MPQRAVADRVAVEIIEHVAHVRLARPDKRNALDLPMFHALAEVGERLKTEPGVRSVVLSGDGASFCAGLDLEALAALAQGSGGVGEDLSSVEGRITHLGQQICWVWREVPVPVIAALQGHALGGGLQLALGADVRLVHPDTQLSVREVYWGLVPDMTGTLLLAELCRPDVALELMTTARIFDGSEAVALGVATRTSATPLDEALALAREIAGRSPHAVRAAKRLLGTAVAARAADQFARERAEITALVGTPNQLEAVTAHFERRPPRFLDPDPADAHVAEEPHR